MTRCDFCNAITLEPTTLTSPKTVTLIPLDDPTIGLYLDTIWNACPDCASLVRAGQFNPLADRVADAYMAAHPCCPPYQRAGCRRHFRALYAAAFEGVSGTVPLGAAA
jgi:hypothetical protein